MKKKTLLSWSSGKDAAWALYLLRQDPAVELVGLFSTVNEAYGRASMHATRIDLLNRQARSVGLPLEMVCLPEVCSNEQYAEAMRRFVDAVRARVVSYERVAGAKTALNSSSKDHTCPAKPAIIAAVGLFSPFFPGFRVCQQ